MARAIEQAIIEVLADTTQFDKKLRNSTERELRRAAAAIEKAFDKATAKQRAFAATAAKSLKGSAFSLRNNADAVNTIVNAIERLQNEFTELGEGGRKAIGILEKQLKRLAQTIVTGPLNAVKRLETAFERSTQRIRASFGRAIVAGPERLEESIRDLRRTAQLESRIIETSVRNALNRLGEANPGLKRLEGQFEKMSRQVRTEYRQALDVAIERLERLRQAGSISQEQFQKEISRTEALLRDKLTRSLERVATQLRLVGGERDEFIKLAKAVAGLDVKIKGVNTTLHQTRRAATSADHALDRMGRRGRLTHLLTSLNRARFAVLNLRIAFTLLGAFLVTRFARAAIDSAKNLELLRLSLQTIALSVEGLPGQSISDFADQAEVAFNRIIKVARETPFSIESVAEATRRLTAVVPSLGLIEDGFDSLEERVTVSLDLFETFGGVLAILGQSGDDSLERLTIALGQIGARAQLTGRDTLRLSRLLPGIPIEETIIRGLKLTEGFDDLNRSIGFTGDNTREAIGNFLGLRMKGLIPAQAAVLGLKNGIDDLFDTSDAIRNFTRTIAGSFEKLGEAAELGVTRGLLPFSQILQEGLAGSIGVVETSAENFGEALTDLARGSIPLVLSAMSGASELFADFGRVTGKFAERNGPALNRSMNAFFDILRNIGRALGTLIDEGLPFFQGLLEFVRAGSRGIAEFTRVLGPVLRSFGELLRIGARLLDTLPGIFSGGALIALFVFREGLQLLIGSLVATATAALGTTATVKGGMLASEAATLRATAAAKAFRTALNRIAVLAAFAAVVGGISWITRTMNAGKDAAEDFQQALDLRFVASNAVTAFEGIEGRASATRDQILKLRRDLVGATKDLESAQASTVASRDVEFGQVPLDNVINRLIDIFRARIRRKGVADELEITNDELDRLTRTASTLDNRIFPAFARRLASLASGFDETRVRSGLTVDQLLAISDAAPEIDLEGIISGLQDGSIENAADAISLLDGQILSATTSAGGFNRLISLAGISLRTFGQISITEGVSALDEFIDRIQTAITGIRDYITTLLEATDPVFRAVQQASRLVELQAELALPESERSRDLAAIAMDAFREFAGLSATTAEIIDEILAGNLDIEHSFGQIDALLSSMGPQGEAAAAALREAFDGAFDTGIEGIDLLAERVNILPDEFKGSAEVLKAVLDPGLRDAILQMPTWANGAIKESSAAFRSLSPEVQRLLRGIQESLREEGRSFKTFAQGLAGDIAGSFSDGPAISLASAAGSGIAEALLSGMTNKLTSNETAGRLAGAGATAVKHVHGGMTLEAQARSPSRLTAALGTDMIDGLMVGMKERTGSLGALSRQIIGDAFRLPSPSASAAGTATSSVTTHSTRNLTIHGNPDPKTRFTARDMMNSWS